MVDRNTETSRTELEFRKEKTGISSFGILRERNQSPRRSGSARSQASNRSDSSPYRDICQARFLYKWSFQWQEDGLSISHLYDKLMLRILRWGSISLGTLTLHWKRYLFVFDKVTGLSWSSWGEDVENQSNVAGSTAWIKKGNRWKGLPEYFKL